MLEKIKYALMPHIVGFFLLLFGWYISILNVGLLDRRGVGSLFSIWTFSGLTMIIIGAYLPDIWIGLRKTSDKRARKIQEKQIIEQLNEQNRTTETEQAAK